MAKKTSSPSIEFNIDLRQVEYPKDVEDMLERQRQANYRYYLERTMSKPMAEELTPVQPWVPLFNSREVIKSAMTFYLRMKFYSKEQNAVIAPIYLRKLVAHITLELSEDKPSYRFTDEELKFLVEEVFESDLPANESMVYVGDLLKKSWEEAREKDVTEKKEE